MSVLKNIRQSTRARMAAGLGLVKGFGVSAESDIGWRTLWGGRGQQYYSGSEIDWVREAGLLWENSALSLCLQYVFNKVAEPRLQVLADDDQGTPHAIAKHPLLKTLRRPNKEYTGRALLQALALSYKVDGNAYCVKARNMGGRGRVVELWYIPHWQMEPQAPDDGGPTRQYCRTVGNTKTYFAAEDVLHFKFGIDPQNPRKGFSPTKAQLRAVVSDGEVESYTAIILRNLGVTLMVSPKNKEDEFAPGTADDMKDAFKKSTTGDQRAGIIVPSIPVDVNRVGSTPQEMALTSIGQRPEARLCASMGLNTMAVGLPSENMKFANLKESREAAYENGIIPMLAVFADALTGGLLEDEGEADGGEYVQFDYSKVRDLQPDVNAEHKRVRENFVRGILKRSRAQEMIGETADPEGDGYYPLIYPGKQPLPDTGGEGANGDGSGQETSS